MECSETLGWLSAWLDGELEPKEAQELEAHVAGCGRCQRRRALLAATSQAIRALSPETVSLGFDGRLRHRLIAETTAAPRRVLRSRLPVLAAGAAALLVLLVLGTPRKTDAPRPPEPSAVGWAVRATPRPALDCRPDLAGRCRADGPCATAQGCGAWPIAALVPEGPRPGP